jgi:aspartate ammonia-lyase
MRKESDFIGEVDIPDEALYGIHALRASQNFGDTTRFSYEWYKATGSVKKACYLTYQKYAGAVIKKYPGKTLPIPLIEPEIISALIQAAGEVESGRYFEHFIVPAIQGGAGTSINLNVNEIIANRALQLSGKKPGTYGFIHPIEHANVFQSTNDVIPSSLKIALLGLTGELTQSINDLRSSIESLEKKSRDHIRIGYTEMQEAVPSTYGRLFSTYNDALSRDWWRTSKCSERIKTVNLGGSAIGTGITVPSLFIREVVQTLREVTGLPVARAENLQDATCNMDSFVEIHAILKSHAVNLEKISSDIRMLSSDMMVNREIHIPPVQVGSSIMPGKVNPVIPEFVISAVHKVYSNDQLIAGLCGLGCLDLNAYIPAIGHAIIESVKLLIASDIALKDKVFDGITLNTSVAMEHMLKNPAITTALVPYIGYNKAAALAGEMKKNALNLFDANEKLGTLNEEKIRKVVTPDNLLKEGFTLSDIIE